MSRSHHSALLIAASLFCAGQATAALFEVGPGKPHLTIQSAVDAAAAADVGSSANDLWSVPAGGGIGPGHPDPVVIQIAGGLYNEQVSIPGDISVAFRGLNDGWTLQNVPGEKVLLQGSVTVGIDRDSLTFNGINIEVQNDVGDGKTAMFFNQTSRYNRIENAIIYDRDPNNSNGTFAGIFFSRAFGHSVIDHVTLFNHGIGLLNDQSSNVVPVSNTIIANSTLHGSNTSAGNPNTFDHSNLWNPAATNGDCNPVSSCTDAGDNVGSGGTWPTGADPLFSSTNPDDPDFLFLTAGSPSAGTGSSAGSMTMGEMNMGALPVFAGISLLLGDANNDGAVTADDLIAVQQNFGNVGPNGDGTDLGDANDDGTVTADDLISVQQNFGNTLGAAGGAVPEPATLAILGLLAPAMLRSRK